MEEFLTLVLEIVLWYAFFQLVFTLYKVWATSKELVEVRNEFKEQLIKKIHYINQELHGECYYWFDKETDQFLAQGINESEIRAHLMERFKDHIFVLDDKRAMFGPELKIVPIDQLPKLFNASTKTS
jgi:hypothetical protein